jgi:hypothetical protein
MTVICDFHVHAYNCYDYQEFFKQIFLKISKLTQDSQETFCLVLCESENCNFYEQLKNDTISLPSEILISKSDDCLKISKHALSFFLFPGFQFNTSEKIELLGLFTEKRVPSGLGLYKSLELLKENSALAVINWAPGKWWGKRGQLINQLIKNNSDLVSTICDTSLRPKGYLTPLLTRQALIKNWKVIHGSDPLPFVEEVSLPLTYYSVLAGNFDPNNAKASMIKLIESQKANAQGARSSFFNLLIRLWKLKKL